MRPAPAHKYTLVLHSYRVMGEFKAMVADKRVAEHAANMPHHHLAQCRLSTHISPHISIIFALSTRDISLPPICLQIYFFFFSPFADIEMCSAACQDHRTLSRTHRQRKKNCLLCLFLIQNAHVLGAVTCSSRGRTHGHIARAAHRLHNHKCTYTILSFHDHMSTNHDYKLHSIVLRGGGRDENGKEGGGNEEGGVIASADTEELIARALEHRGRAVKGTDCDVGKGHGDSKEMGRLEDMLEQDLLQGDAAVAAAEHMEDNDSTWAHTLGLATSLAASTTSTQLPHRQVDAPPVLQAGTEHARRAAQVQAHVDVADVPLAKGNTPECAPRHNALRLDLLRHADARDPRPRQRDLQDDPAYTLEPLVRQWVVILFKDGTNMAGVLQVPDCLFRSMCSHVLN